MGKLRILSKKTVNQIAAGEVIERPASVVKELIENSIDADADEIHVDVERAGKELIRVSDNGVGMDEDELELAFKKHATSKIDDIYDLKDLRTLGFRGEALSSISSVSRVKATSKTKKSLEGNVIEIHGDEKISMEKRGSPEGTIIEVRDLFYNTPARRNYLKKDSTELSHISEVVTRYSLINADIEFKLTHDGKELLFVPKTNSVLENIKFIYGKEIARKTVRVKKADDMVIMGYTTKPEITRASRDHIYTYVNSRYVRNKELKDAIVKGYGTLLPKHRYPITVIDLLIDPDEIDVNVHPTKIKIRFAKEKDVKEDISDCISETLLSHDLIPQPKEKTSSEKKKDEVQEIEKSFEQSRIYIEDDDEIYESSLPYMRVLGIIKDTYIIVETNEGMAVVDQHAAHERINYEKFKKQYHQGIKTQDLMSPITVEVNPKEAALLKANKKLLEELGMKIEPFGRTTFRLSSLPVLMGELQPKDILLSVIDQLFDFKGKPLEERREELIRYMACHSSVTAGDLLSTSSAKRILSQLGLTRNPYTCPHGRPIIVRFEENEINKWFKRN